MIYAEAHRRSTRQKPVREYQLTTELLSRAEEKYLSLQLDMSTCALAADQCVWPMALLLLYAVWVATSPSRKYMQVSAYTGAKYLLMVDIQESIVLRFGR